MGGKKNFFRRPSFSTPMIMDLSVSASDVLIMPVTGVARIDWGDGTVTLYEGDVQDKTHTYTTTETVTAEVSIIVGSFKSDNTGLFITALVNLKEWGDNEFRGLNFYGCSNMVITATDVPNLSKLSNLLNLFINCTSLTVVPNINLWEVGHITNFNSAFRSCTQLTMDLSDWDMSSVTGGGMYRMFYNAQSFNSDLSGWVISGITNLEQTFENCYLFDSDLSGFDVSLVTTFQSTFHSASIFNGNIDNWNVIRGATFQAMFKAANLFNRNIGAWTFRTDTAINMSSMLWCDAFNQDISGWDVSRVNNFALFLFSNPVFDQDLSSWDMTDSVSGMHYSQVNSIHYEAMITAWNLQALSDSGGNLHQFGNCTYAQGSVASGEVDSLVPFKLIDSGALFLGTVNVGDVIHNVTPQPNELYEWKYSTVISVDSDTQLTLAHDIMTITIVGSTFPKYDVETSAFAHIKENMQNVKGWRFNDGNVVA